MCIEIHNSHLTEIFYTVNTFREVITLAFGNKERESLLGKYEGSNEDPKSWDLYNLRATANQAGTEGERAREILRKHGLL